MAKTIKIALDDAQYATPTQEDINAAKQYILQREDYASILGDRIDEILAEAAERIVTICYKYNVNPKDFTISSKYNADMMEEIEEVMDELEDEILNLINEYSTRATNDKDRMNALVLWLATLGRGNRNLKDTLHTYLYKTLKDWEAAIAAMKAAGLTLPQAITRIRTYLHNIYSMPEVLAAFKNPQNFVATYILSRGVQKGAVGISNNGATNVINMAKITLQMAWMKSLYQDYKEDGVAMYSVQRGSTYPCDLCDSHVGIWDIKDESHFPPFHPHCCCFVIPIYPKNSYNSKT